MRRVKTGFVLLTAACALCVLGAAPALAHQFVASKTGKIKGNGLEEVKWEKGEIPPYEPERMQEWKFGTFKILCYKEHNGETEITQGGHEELTLTLHYGSCGWYPQNNSLHVSATFAKEGITVTFHANGWVQALENGTAEEVEFKNAVIRNTAAYFKITSTKLCKIIIPEQTIPVAATKKPGEEYSSAVFSNVERESTNLKLFPSGFQTRLLIVNHWTHLWFKYGTPEEEKPTQCREAPEFEKISTEGSNTGLHNGSIEEQLVGGNLSFE